MRRNLFSSVLIALMVVVSFGACANSTSGGGGGSSTLTSLANTSWSDEQTPENKMIFGSSTVTLAGDSSITTGYWNQISLFNATLPFSEVSDYSSAEIEPAAQVWTDKANGIGFELYYYAATDEKRERLVVYCNNLQPREFYRH